MLLPLFADLLARGGLPDESLIEILNKYWIIASPFFDCPVTTILSQLTTHTTITDQECIYLLRVCPQLRVRDLIAWLIAHKLPLSAHARQLCILRTSPDSLPVLCPSLSLDPIDRRLALERCYRMDSLARLAAVLMPLSSNERKYIIVNASARNQIIHFVSHVFYELFSYEEGHQLVSLNASPRHIIPIYHLLPPIIRHRCVKLKMPRIPDSLCLYDNEALRAFCENAPVDFASLSFYDISRCFPFLSRSQITHVLTLPQTRFKLKHLQPVKSKLLRCLTPTWSSHDIIRCVARYHKKLTPAEVQLAFNLVATPLIPELVRHIRVSSPELNRLILARHDGIDLCAVLPIFSTYSHLLEVCPQNHIYQVFSAIKGPSLTARYITLIRAYIPTVRLLAIDLESSMTYEERVIIARRLSRADPPSPAVSHLHHPCHNCRESLA